MRLRSNSSILLRMTRKAPVVATGPSPVIQPAMPDELRFIAWSWGACQVSLTADGNIASFGDEGGPGAVATFGAVRTAYDSPFVDPVELPIDPTNSRPAYFITVNAIVGGIDYDLASNPDSLNASIGIGYTSGSDDITVSGGFANHNDIEASSLKTFDSFYLTRWHFGPGYAFVRDPLQIGDEMAVAANVNDSAFFLSFKAVAG